MEAASEQIALVSLFSACVNITVNVKCCRRLKSPEQLCRTAAVEAVVCSVDYCISTFISLGFPLHFFHKIKGIFSNFRHSTFVICRRVQ